MTIDILSGIVALIAYLLGCFPTSWLLVRYVTKRDVRELGTGNMGGMNSYEVTGHKWVGITVTLVDALKGFAAVAIAKALGADFYGICMAGVFAVLGHCFNIFFRFHGGRGLATATGVFLAINPLPMILWDLMYLTGYFVIRRDVHVGSVSGTLGTLILTITTPTLIVAKLMFVPVYDVGQFKMMVYICCVVIFIRHIEPMRALFRRMQEEEAAEARATQSESSPDSKD